MSENVRRFVPSLASGRSRTHAETLHGGAGLVEEGGRGHGAWGHAGKTSVVERRFKFVETVYINTFIIFFVDQNCLASRGRI